MRWTGNIRFLFLAPAVIWVLAFTVFPLGYSLYLAFYKIEQKVEVKREKQPLLDAAGKPVLDDSGQPRDLSLAARSLFPILDKVFLRPILLYSLSIG